MQGALKGIKILGWGREREFSKLFQENKHYFWSCQKKDQAFNSELRVTIPKFSQKLILEKDEEDQVPFLCAILIPTSFFSRSTTSCGVRQVPVARSPSPLEFYGTLPRTYFFFDIFDHLLR
jgi:hypothetical protein